jgi:hypothetical protein
MYNVDAGCDEIFNNKGTVNRIKDLIWYFNSIDFKT